MMLHKQSIKVIAFDFDGTLVDSNYVKQQAYYQLFAPTPQNRQAIDAVLTLNSEAPRRQIISQILQRTEAHSCTETRGIDQLCDRYGQLTLEGVLACDSLPEAPQVLEQLSKSQRLYVNSGTYQQPLEKLIEARGWRDFFVGIFGYPCLKADALRQIMDSEAVDAAAVLVVGDGQSDADAANEVGCKLFRIGVDGELSELLDVVMGKRICNKKRD